MSEAAKERAQRRAQREADRRGVGVNDGYGNIWYPADPSGIPVYQPDYGHICKP